MLTRARVWWCVLVGLTSLQAGAQGAGRLVLPEAPSAVLARAMLEPEGAKTATVTGQITDKNGNGVAGAEVELLPEAGASAGQAIEKSATDGEGLYVIRGVPAGSYKLQVMAQGFREEALAVEVRASREREELPTVMLQLASTSADVEVTATTEQIAQEQLHDQLQQRALGIFPNFYTSFVWGAAPMNARQKFSLAAHARFDPVTIVGTAIGAGVQTAAGRYKGYGDGPVGFGKRFGSAFATSAAGRFFGSALLPSVFHQDPRYFYDGRGSVGSRGVYAVTRVLVTRSDRGTSQPNYSFVLGQLMAAGLSNAYVPASSRTVSTTLTTVGIRLAAEAGANLVREFVLKGLTGKVPSYGHGRPEEPADRGHGRPEEPADRGRGRPPEEADPFPKH